MEKSRGTYMVVLRKPEGRKTLGESRRGGRIILKWILEKWDGGHGVDRSGLG